MRFSLQLLLSRWRRNWVLTALRLVSLVLTASLAASVPTFVAGAMERVLATKAAPESARSLVVSWSEQAGGAGAKAGTQALSAYLGSELPAAVGLPGSVMEQLDATVPLPIQAMAEGKVQPARRYYRLSPLPAGLKLSEGRFPQPGRAEVAIPQSVMMKAGYQAGSRLRIPTSPDGRATAAEVVVTGIYLPPDEGALQQLSGSLESTLLTSPEYWQSLNLPVGGAVWALLFPEEELHTRQVPALVAALGRLPVELVRIVPGAEVTSTPQIWLAEFAGQMEATRRFMLVLLLPVFLLLLFFVSATAGATVEGRQTEVAVLRSRGMTPLRVIGFYLPESLALVGAGTLVGLALVVPAVQTMGLAAGFLKLVGRPPMPVTVSVDTALYALAAALLAEMVSLAPLARAARQTVVSLRQEAAAESAVWSALRAVAELALIGVAVYGTWRLMAGVAVAAGGAGAGAGSDPLLWLLPPLALAAAGLLFLRLLELAVYLVERLLSRWLSSALYLAVSILRRSTTRHRVLAFMLVMTAGMGVYAASFARTLDRDLAARSLYGGGSDLRLMELWEREVRPDGSTIYYEPPYGRVGGLPGVEATARYQTRRDVTLRSGSRNLAQVEIVGVEPQEFGGTARFLPELNPEPAAYLNALGSDEQAVLVSAGLARRLGLKPGDRLNASQEGGEADLVMVGTATFWPGRLPEQGDFIVGNLLYLQDRLGLYPYEVMLRAVPDAPAVPMVEELRGRGGKLVSLTDSRSLLAVGRRDPFRLSVYATLSTGFVVALVAMLLTYLLSAGLTLQSRAKELGVLRAMGMTAGQVTRSLYLEQLTLVVSGAAVGLGAGVLAARLYVPAFRQQPGETLLPLRVADLASDRLSMLLVLLSALVIGTLVISAQMRRLNVTAVLRLGEEK